MGPGGELNVFSFLSMLNILVENKLVPQKSCQITEQGP